MIWHRSPVLVRVVYGVAGPVAAGLMVLGVVVAAYQVSRWLTAYDQGDQLASIAAGAIAVALGKQGRTDELLRLQAGLPLPAGPFRRFMTHNAAAAAWALLLLPSMPPEAVDLAVARTRWVLANAEFPSGDPARSREAMLHTLALGYLRQGRFPEAEKLCQPALGLPDLAPKRPGHRAGHRRARPPRRRPALPATP